MHPHKSIQVHLLHISPCGCGERAFNLVTSLDVIIKVMWTKYFNALHLKSAFFSATCVLKLTYFVFCIFLSLCIETIVSGYTTCRWYTGLEVLHRWCSDGLTEPRLWASSCSYPPLPFTRPVSHRAQSTGRRKYEHTYNTLIIWAIQHTYNTLILWAIQHTYNTLILFNTQNALKFSINPCCNVIFVDSFVAKYLNLKLKMKPPPDV